MYISGLQKTSLIDYPENISAVIFTSGCNFNCGFCHNPELVNPKLYLPEIPEYKILDFLRKRKKVLDAVVITGGEPTIYPDLINFIKKIKKLGYLIKLDTNGTNPDIINNLITNNLIDYIAMDIKGPLDKYQEITGCLVDIGKIKQSIQIIKNIRVSPRRSPRESALVDYEFRTTVVPTLHKKENFRSIGKMIKGAKKYYLQQFRPTKTLSPKFKTITPFSQSQLQEFKIIMEKYVKEVEIRGI
ncbi:anaerobic ribonucleoside-triphosphate reductase activating protein [Candidatus Berkelbacteria bacterium RIFCSPHIGHO2_12_FULL_36_9]|uniref:Anaerobic ribonucleoside-triphosphate reductase activating protein n=1 Tax=Candidatus Berkelbacteria bacterium RIFCSPHIGHO2_12_FULL_36_9 TaxID=1797469 RepID=A0A1F5EKD0_9BACT|nr:MAG: anaerobic ribonucleoside-triphosphate reductase activating protein [Candidatus Berkelbacteria bacterium RIFCSPHIGHO2_12_FULL_36_9]